MLAVAFYLAYLWILLPAIKRVSKNYIRILENSNVILAYITQKKG